MVSAMHPMKFSPFAGGQRSKDRMLGYRLTSSELAVTLGDYVLHAGDIFKDFVVSCAMGVPRGKARAGDLRPKEHIRAI